MSAEVRSGGGESPARFFAECRPCGWTSPVGGFVTKGTAQYRVEEHDRETHGLTGDCEVDCQEACAYPGRFSECTDGALADGVTAPDDEDHIRQPALGRIYPSGNRAI